MKKKLIVLLAGLLALAVLVFPLFVDNLYIIHTCLMIFLFATMGMGWNLIGGYGAQLSLGHAAFFAVGAYTAVLFVVYKSVTPLLGGIVGILLAVGLAIIIGLPSFRLRGPYFTLSTIAAAEIVRTLLLHFQPFTGGANGIPIPFKGENALFLQFYSKAPYYYIALAMFVAVFFLIRFLEKSKIGRYLAAIREDQDAAESLGIKTHQIKMIALVISAAITAACGILYAFTVGFIDPDSIAGLSLSIEIAVVVIVGGIGTLWGPIVGSVVVILLTELTNMYLGAMRSGASLMLYGLLLVVVILFKPQGLSALFRRKS